MYLMTYVDESGKIVYTLKACPLSALPRAVQPR